MQTMKHSAPEPDAITVAQIKNFSPKDLSVLYNTMLYSGYVPSILKRCRTTRIPKNNDTTKIGNWRLITVSYIILHLFNKILASRFNTLKINSAKRGFRPLDGCIANTLGVQTIIKEHREKVKPYNVVTIDLRKAFDTVSASSIPRALRRVGIHRKTIDLIVEQYQEFSTAISCCGATTSNIPIRRGVKQGDPLSPMIFNLIIDELLSGLNPEYGLAIGDQRIPAIAYADKLVIFGPDVYSTQATLNLTHEFLQHRGLSINQLKCTAFTADRVRRKKKLYIVSMPKFTIDGVKLRQIGIDEQFKNLGTIFHYTLPRLLHELQYPSVTSSTIKDSVNTLNISSTCGQPRLRTSSTRNAGTAVLASRS